MRAATSLILALALAAAGSAAAAPVDEILAGYRAAGAGAGPFDAAAGRAAWGNVTAIKGEQRSCTDCHGSDLKKGGSHAKTKKPIEPLAPSANPARLTDPAKVEKWFVRNCTWTLGRECTAQEKGDFLAYIRGQ